MTYATKPQADRCDFHPRVACVERYHDALFSDLLLLARADERAAALCRRGIPNIA